jgi:hypothetical protein
LFGLHLEAAKQIADAVRAFQQLLIGDSLVATFNRNLSPSSLEYIAID